MLNLSNNSYVLKLTVNCRKASISSMFLFKTHQWGEEPISASIVKAHDLWDSEEITMIYEQLNNQIADHINTYKYI